MYCFSCCSTILRFGDLEEKEYSYLIDNRNNFGTTSKNSSIFLKPPLNLSLSFNQINNSCPEQNIDPENVVNSVNFNIEQIQSLEFPDKKKLPFLFHINSSINKSFDLS